MADIIYPDLGNALRNVAALRGMEQQNLQFQEERQARQRRQALAPDVQAALGGDNAAVQRIAGADPEYAMRIAPLLDRMDANKRAVLKDAADFTTQVGMGVLNTPPELRPQAFAAAHAEAKRRGMDTSTWPTEWSPQAEGWLTFNVKKAIPVATWFAENERTAREAAGQPVPLTAGGGVSPYNIGNVRPVGGGPTSGFQQPASLDDGIRLAVSNVQAYPAKFNGGQPMTLLQIGQRWAPAGDGKNDPAAWARNVAQIGGLPVDQPLDFANPQVQAAFARGVHGAEHGAQAVQPIEVYQKAIATGGGRPAPTPAGGFTPGAPPAQSIPGAMPQIAQGDMPQTAPVAPGQQPPSAAFSDLLTRLPQGATLLVNPKTRLPTYDAQGRVAVQFPDGSRNFVEIPKPGKGGEAGPLTGTGMDQQMMNILLTGDPSTQQYAAAYAHMSRPRTTVDDQGRPITIQPMDMTMFGKPTFGRGGQPTGPAPLPEGTVQQDLPGGGTVTVMPSVAEKGPSQKEQADLREMRVEADKVRAAAQDYLNEWKKASPAERARSLTGANTPLNTAYNNFALLTKGDVLFKLGVLNGPDLGIIRRAIADPSTLISMQAKDSDVESSVAKIMNVLDTGVKAKATELEKARGGAKGGATAGQTYTGPDGKPILWKEIEDTAKARNTTPDAVIQQLGLKPFGAK